jgi:hypothetical protein
MFILFTNITPQDSVMAALAVEIKQLLPALHLLSQQASLFPALIIQL